MPLLSFWPFCSGVLPSPTPSLSLRARLQLPKGSCHPPPFPTASCCPQKQQWSLWCLAGDFRELGMDSFPWEPSPTIGQRDRCCVRPCHPLPLPVPALGTSTAAASSGGACQGGSVPVGQLPPASASRQQVASLWGRTVAPWCGGSLVGVCKATSSLHVGRGTFLSGPGPGVAPAHPRGACVARGGAAARPCLWEAVAALLGGQPHAPLSQKHPLRCRELLTQAGG